MVDRHCRQKVVATLLLAAAVFFVGIGQELLSGRAVNLRAEIALTARVEGCLLTNTRISGREASKQFVGLVGLT